MRKSKKKELMNCIDTLQKANGKVLKIDSTARVDFLTQCQEMAIMVGTEIDKIEGEGIVTVSYLEQYCEEIYLMSVAADRGDLIQAQKRAHTLLGQIKESILADIADSPAEVVFLPYKASMWDALDSVYRAAVADGNCKVTVMPIPYFNINPQGEVLAVEYEGALFPKDIKITDFRDYDLEAMHPDVIFIHNPYDEWNHVTQVPKEFFSSTLVNYTEHLVYIPYFVTKGDTIKDDYCYMPAVRNAWRTFVQSEAVRDCYIKNGADPKKIVAMGSPKFDMVLQMQENPPAMPEEWKEALGGRKIFLLNTHLNPIINEAEGTIDKLQQIFQLFRERDDVALLWRPHPLSIQTAKSMNPRILEQYMQLIEEFKTLPNVVYDDTPDVHRAIALSDAYIGHGSSLVTMYGITGKPMYMLSVSGDANVRIPEKEKYLQFACGVMHDRYLWAPAEDHNGLYRIDMETNRAEFVTYFEKENLYGKEMYREVILCGDDIYFIPFSAKYMAVYHILTGVMNYVELDYGDKTKAVKFGGGVQFKHYIYLFPACTPFIVRYDIKSGSVDYMRECCEKLEKIQDLYSTFLDGVHIEDKIFVVSRKGNCFVELSEDSQAFKVHYLKETSEPLLDIAEEAGKLYLLTVQGEVIQWDVTLEKETLIWRYNDYIKGENGRRYSGELTDVPYAKIEIRHNHLFLFPYQEQEIVQICLNDTDKIYRIKIPSAYKTWELGKNKTKGIIVNDGMIMMCPANANCLLKLDCNAENNKISEMFIQNGGFEYGRYNKGPEQIECETEFYREREWKVENYVNIVTQVTDTHQEMRKRKFRNVQSGLNYNCGEEIWKYIAKDI